MKTALLDTAIKIAQKAGKLVLKESLKNISITEKRRNDLVTNVDKASEKLIIQEIKKAFPDHGIFAEESATTGSFSELSEHEYIWIIDPIDGTTNFAHGLPLYSISIGVFETKIAETSKNYDYLTGELVAAVIFAPALNELFYAEKDQGAYLNGKRIHVSKTAKIEKSLAVTGFPYLHKETNTPYWNFMLHHSRAVRRLGSAALDLAYVAAGRFDCFWEFDLEAWDIAAGALIVEEAGGHVTDTNGELLDLFGQDILATNGKVHNEVIKEFSEL